MDNCRSDFFFPIRFVQIVRCSHDGSELKLQDGYSTPARELDVIKSGALACVSCGAIFAIENGVLNLINTIEIDERSATEQLKRNADSYTVQALDTPISIANNEMKMIPTLEALPVTPADVLLELGCGDGRYTLRLADRCDVLAVDFAEGPLRKLQQRLPKNSRRTGLILGDVSTMKVAPNKFDFVLSTLTSNLPTREHRESLYRLAQSALAMNGRFVFSSHLQGIRQRLAGEKKSGYYQDGGIYRYNFSFREALDEVRPHFHSVTARPIQIYPPLARTLRLPVVRLSRFLERIPLLNMFGNLLLIVAKRPRPISHSPD